MPDGLDKPVEAEFVIVRGCRKRRRQWDCDDGMRGDCLRADRGFGRVRAGAGTRHTALGGRRHDPHVSRSIGVFAMSDFDDAYHEDVMLVLSSTAPTDPRNR